MENKYFLVHKAGQKPEIVFGNILDVNLNINGGGSRSRGYESEEELKIGEGILEKVCTICGSMINTSYIEPVKSELISKNVCFNCNYWLGIEKDLTNPNRFIVNGEAYFMTPDAVPGTSFVGFGGSKFNIQRLDSEEIIVSHNLWCNGTVPDHFKERIPNNAKFLR